jgi:GntR family transcriptional regulator, transcriptional repressor for pyruvate dehydrogenase complex
VKSSTTDSTSVKSGEAVARMLRSDIANGRLRSGDHLLPEDELMEHFGVARTTLREGLRILESQGLLTIRRGRHGGPQVTAPPVDRLAQGFAVHLQLEHTTIGDLDEARQLIEPALAARLARRHDKDDLDALTQAVELADEAAQRDDVAGFGEAVARVHRTLAERGDNHTLALVSLVLHQVVGQYYLVGARHSTQALRKRAVRSYRKLIQLIASGDAEGAASHWRKQLTFTADQSGRNRRLDVFSDRV